MREKKDAVEAALRQFASGDLADNAKNLLNTLGYDSQRTVRLEPNTADGFLSAFDSDDINAERALCEEWDSVDVLFQLLDDQIRDNANIEIDFGGSGIDAESYQSYLFFALRLRGDHYTRTQLSQITREINKPFGMPAMVLFQHGETLTFAVIDRRLSKVDESKDVLEKATLIKDINFADPHRAHIDILFDLSIAELHEKYGFRNFEQLHEAWREALDTEELNRQFYRRLYDWFEWAVREGKFPKDKKRSLKPEEHVIRLITRILFVWFIKEKGLVSDKLFDEKRVKRLLKDYDRDNGDSYYRAVLQNLFFATLNTEIEKRRFSEGEPDHRNFSVYRYKDQISRHEELLALFGETPFINGGLFDCLDDFKGIRAGGSRIDCFSDRHYKKLSVPNCLFFDKGHGLFPLLTHYKFTVEENTPIEQEVALDPELLGKVFENLLAAYNPETGETVRRQTGSYYTPRAIVDYMVEEALVATLTQQVVPTNDNTELWEEELRYLFDYAQECDDASEWFDDDETDKLVRAISELKILDPAVGSGAFPMGVLHKLTLALRRLDPDNTRWKQLQEQHAGKRASGVFRTQDDRTRREKLLEIDETFKRYRDSDFGRKLYLIQNGIYGVDIQPVACQIAKLRFFISLAIEQEPDRDASNFGIKPLPNLETRFVTANTLIGLELSETRLLLQEDSVQRLINEIKGIRDKHFLTNNRQRKLDLEDQEDEFREQLKHELENQRATWVEIQRREIERKVDSLPKPEQREQLREVEEKKYEERKEEFDSGFEDARKIAGWKPYDQNASADWFDPEGMFGIANGFDLVIGNPPYVQLQKNGGKLGRLYESCNFDSFTRTGDIYCLFYEKANQLSRNDGHTCFITSNKWMRAGYGNKLRNYLFQNTQPVKLIDMGPDVFDAAVDTNILLMRNLAPKAGVTIRAVTIGSDFDKQAADIAQYLHKNGVDMEFPTKGDPWAILSTVDVSMKRKMINQGKPLSEYLKGEIYRGIITGLNEAFVVDRETRDNLILEDPSSAEVLKPFLRGRDVRRWRMNFAEQYLIVIESSENRAHPWSDESAVEAEMIFATRYPAIHTHLAPFRDRLMNRQDKGKFFWELRSCKYWNEFEGTKIIYPDIFQHQSFTVDRTMFYCGNTCYFIPTKETWLCGLLNSRAVEWFYSLISNSLGAGGLRAFTEKMKQIPVPDINIAEKERVSEIVDQILAKKREDAGADVSALENEIDQIVYLLYNLTPEEIQIVEENTV